MLITIPEAAVRLGGVPIKPLARTALAHGLLIRIGSSSFVKEAELGELIEKCGGFFLDQHRNAPTCLLAPVARFPARRAGRNRKEREMKLSDIAASQAMSLMQRQHIPITLVPEPWAKQGQDDDRGERIRTSGPCLPKTVPSDTGTEK